LRTSIPFDGHFPITPSNVYGTNLLKIITFHRNLKLIMENDTSTEERWGVIPNTSTPSVSALIESTPSTASLRRMRFTLLLHLPVSMA